MLIVPTLSGETPNDYAQGVAEKWHIGKKGADNGVLLLVVPPPEKKAWIATGYGIQGWLTDIDCAHVVSDVMKPLNLQGKRAQAVVAGVDAIIGKLGNTPWAKRPKRAPPASLPGWAWILIIVVVIILCCIPTNDGLLLFVILNAMVNSDGGDGGFGGFGDGGFGGGGGGGSSG